MIRWPQCEVNPESAASQVPTPPDPHTGPSTGAMTAEQHKTLNFIRRSYRGHCCCLLSGARPFWKRYCRLRGHFNDGANKGSAVSPRWQKCWSAADNAASTLSVRFKAVSLLCTWVAQCVGMLHSGTHPKTRLSFSLGVKVAPKPPLINCFSGVDKTAQPCRGSWSLMVRLSL